MWKVEGEREQAKRKKVREHQSSHGHTLIPAADVAALGQTKRGPVGGRSLAMHCLRDSFFSTHRHKAILDYLHANNFMSAFHSLRADTGSDYTPDPSSKSRAILEKKWTTVIRLQKKEYLFLSFLSLAAHSSLSLYRSLILNPATRLSRTIYPPHPQNVPITPTGFLEIHPHIPSPATVPPLPRSPSIHSIPS